MSGTKTDAPTDEPSTIKPEDRVTLTFEVTVRGGELSGPRTNYAHQQLERYAKDWAKMVRSVTGTEPTIESHTDNPCPLLAECFGVSATADVSQCIDAEKRWLARSTERMEKAARVVFERVCIEDTGFPEPDVVEADE